MSDAEWIPLDAATPQYCKFFRQPVYWKKSERTIDQYGNLIYAPPREARVREDGTVEYRDVPHKCRRRS